MRIAYLDCFSGISGDMLLGALIDAGVPAELFRSTVAALDVGARLEVMRVDRSGINAAKVEVYCHGEKELPREQFWAKQAAGGMAGHDSAHAHRHGSGGHHGRGLQQIRDIIRGAKLSEATRKTAIGIFEKLGAAEAKIHGIPVDQVHFHEVGAVDAMVDVVCAAAGAEHLHVEEWVCSPLNVGSGTVQCAHGTFPVPAPATLELLQGAPVYSSGPPFELVTPTGAAIVAELVSHFGVFPGMRAERMGYGAGSRDTARHPNVLRLTLGESQPGEAPGEEKVAVLEASLDDLNPQVFGYVLERALAEGALEAFGTPLQMKKSRPGMLLTVLARSSDADRLARLIFAETTTLGVRMREERRQALHRQWTGVQTRWGEVRVKVASLNGTTSNFAPEYEDCRRIAGEHGVPLKAVMQEAIQAYLRQSELNG
jgi:uncharacterized protein (TIGR00299 family) protein